MDIIKCVNLVGIALGLVGVSLLLFIDLPYRKLAEAEERLPPSMFSDRVRAELSNEKYEVSSQERRFLYLERAISAKRSLLIFRIGIGFVIAGSLCQLAAALMDLMH